MMTGLSSLWTPVLLSSVIVFVVSSIIHMTPLWHKNDFPKIPNEDKLRDAMRPLGIPPGDYMVPRPSPAEMRTPEFAEKVRMGPVMVVTVMPNAMPSMARNLVQWFAFCVTGGGFSAYVDGRALPPGR